MTLIHEEQIACPECGNLKKVRIYRSVNATLDHKLKHDLLNGDINWFDCEACEFQSYLPVPFLYHDMELKFCVQFVPLEQALDPSFLKNFGSDGRFIMPEMGPIDLGQNYMSNQHLVFNMHELIGYVMFREKLAEYHESNA
jgi:hypothetical protein